VVAAPARSRGAKGAQNLRAPQWRSHLRVCERRLALAFVAESQATRRVPVFFAFLRGNRRPHRDRSEKGTTRCGRSFLERVGLVAHRHLGNRLLERAPLHLYQSDRRRMRPRYPRGLRARAATVPLTFDPRRTVSGTSHAMRDAQFLTQWPYRGGGETGPGGDEDLSKRPIVVALLLEALSSTRGRRAPQAPKGPCLPEIAGHRRRKSDATRPREPLLYRAVMLLRGRIAARFAACRLESLQGLPLNGRPQDRIAARFAAQQPPTQSNRCKVCRRTCTNGEPHAWPSIGGPEGGSHVDT
jgi:hypothetical protein